MEACQPAIKRPSLQGGPKVDLPLWQRPELRIGAVGKAFGIVALAVFLAEMAPAEPIIAA
jgi:hypothetical protein